MPQDGIPPAIGLPIAFLLVLLNGFFVAAEFAIVKVRGTRLAELASRGSSMARQAELITSHLDEYLAATQLGITIASLGLGWIGEPAVASVLKPALHDWLGLSVEAVEVIAFGVGFALITMFHITLGELAPKSIAILRPDTTTLVVAWPLRIFARVAWPAIWALNGLANLMLRTIGLRAAPDSELVHSEEELRLLLASSGERGVLDPIEQELASRSLALGELSVREIMVPRTEMRALAADLSLHAARGAAIEARHARLPVHHGSADNVTGYVEWLDLFGSDDPDWTDRVRDMPVLPASVSASLALGRLREAHAEIALIVDEYGGTAGILTVRDILDEIAERETAPERSAVPGTTPIHLLAGVEGLDVADSAAATVGGYVTSRLGRIPEPGERISAGDWDIVVERATDHRIVSTRLIRSGEAAPAPPPSAGPPSAR